MTRTRVRVELLIVALIAAAFVFVTARPAHACSCVGATEAQHVEAADVVFARETSGGLNVNLCGGTRPAAAGEAPAIDRPAPPPEPIPPAPPPDPIVATPRLTG